MAAGSDKGAVNDSIDELLDGVPADPMLPKKRARSIEEVKAAQAAAPPSGRCEDDKVVVREGSDPRERAKIEAERARRESSTFGTSFLLAQANRTRWVVGVLVTLGVLAIYVFVRHARHKEEVVATAAPTASTQVMHVLSASAVPLAADDLPPPPAVADAPLTTAPSTAITTPAPAHGRTKSSRSTEGSAQKPPPAAVSAAPSASNARTDVARSL